MQHPYAEFIGRVEKPARYLGGEYQSVVKDPATVDVSIALAFPDVYDIGMSHLGTKILYSLLNKDAKIACERAFTPWTDMEAELRARKLPLVTLESARPLSAFDVVGMSLQYELTFTNVLTLLDLGGIPLRAEARGESDPLVIGGGPTATHPEPVAAFFDAFLVGEAEEVLPSLLKYWAEMKREGLPRRERLIRLSMRGGVYVPSLYTMTVDERTGLEVVSGVVDERVPRKVVRTWVKDINAFPFPSDAPVPYAEAVFDRVSVEIARGCTEGCRFCQAGMIYRPVRERDPDAIVKSVVDGVKNGGYDETSLTALSTADVSCITPLVKRVMGELKRQKVSLSVSSLRAYGLNEELLDEMSTVRATGLTFAPEAGTQRMRDVINKNVTEADIMASAEKVFSRGWSRMKCYFMIGLPTETDEDVVGIPQTGGRLRRLGRGIRRDADVTVSVSTHVPKPHTPFQWCAMDSLDDTKRKQRLLREVAREERIDLKWHEAEGSHVEGVLSRGDRRLADVIEAAWRGGARFDGWEEHFRFARWQAAFAQHHIDVESYLGTRPTDARLPWDHIDVGLAEGFLAWEYRRALKDRLSPPCGKPNKTLLHHTNIEDAEADQRKLVCYDCGIACDLTDMRQERLVYLRKLDARKGAAPSTPSARHEAGVQARPTAGFADEEGVRFRLRYEKVGRLAFTGHLDMSRLLQRVFRRAGINVIYSRGFHPKPVMTFSPALGLGIAALGEVLDIRLSYGGDASALLAALDKAVPDGLRFLGARQLEASEPALPKILAESDFAAWLPSVPAMLAPLAGVTVQRSGEHGRKKRVDVGGCVLGAPTVTSDASLVARLDWPTDGAVLRFTLRAGQDGSAKPSEVVAALFGLDDAAELPPGIRYARIAVRGLSSADLLAPALRPAA
jgi:radical SAM family uncharacterized protein/radical SAM-linked protein